MRYDVCRLASGDSRPFRNEMSVDIRGSHTQDDILSKTDLQMSNQSFVLSVVRVEEGKSEIHKLMPKVSGTGLTLNAH